MELGEPDESGRRRPRPIAGSNLTMPVDLAVIAVGLSPNPLLPALTKGLSTDADGHIVVNEKMMSSIPGVFAGGDIVGGDTVIVAMGMGKKAAKSIADYLLNKK